LLNTNKYLIKFFEWLYFAETHSDYGYKIVKIKGFNRFLVDGSSSRMSIYCIWDKGRILGLLRRFLGIKDKEEVYIDQDGDLKTSN